MGKRNQVAVLSLALTAVAAITGGIGARIGSIGSGRSKATVLTWTSRDGVPGIRVRTGVGATGS
jgi:hypothetical protein